LATNESDFKSSFRRDLKDYHKEAVIWTNTDRFVVGLPDFCVSHQGGFYAIEAKFVRELPKRKESKCLKHEVSAKQADFLNNIRGTSNHAAVLIGFPDVAVVMKEIKSNYTLEEVLDPTKCFTIQRRKGRWDIDLFLGVVRRYTLNLAVDCFTSLEDARKP